MMSRRKLLGSVVAAGVSTRLAVAWDQPVRIGETDWNLDLGASPDAVPLAAKLGFEGVQISFGRKLVDGMMPVDHPEVVARYLKLSRENKIPIDGTCVD